MDSMSSTVMRTDKGFGLTTKTMTFPSLFPNTCYCSLQLLKLSSHLVLRALRLQPDRTGIGFEAVENHLLWWIIIYIFFFLNFFKILPSRFSQSFFKICKCELQLQYLHVPPGASQLLLALSVSGGTAASGGWLKKSHFVSNTQCWHLSHSFSHSLVETVFTFSKFYVQPFHGVSQLKH